MSEKDRIEPMMTDMIDGQNLEAMDTSNPHQLRKKFLLTLVRVNARCLPSLSDLGQVFLPYLALTRGDRFPLDNYIDCYLNAIQDYSGRVQRKARELRIDFEVLDQKVMINSLYLVAINPRMTLYEATDQYINTVSASRLDCASETEINSALEVLIDGLIQWLRMNGVPFSIKPSISIPITSLNSILQPFKGLPDFHLGEDIPSQKLANAVESAHIPGDETVSALIDCTFFGSAKDCVLFGGRAVYFNNGGINSFLPYSEFPDTVFSIKSDSIVRCDNYGVISLSGSSFTADRLTAALDLIKREAISRERSADVKENKGLSTIPGMSELKLMLQEEIIAPLRDPERFKKYKIEIPNGILMYGPPGCGKTFIAQRLASELNYNFYEISPSAVASSYVHGSTNMIKRIFEEATKNAPALMFVDEFEGMVPARRSLGGEQQFKAEEVNEWLVQIGSCAQRKILFVAATNEPWSIDEAIQRSGRLDKKVYVGPPDREALTDMLLYHLEGRPFTSEQDVRDFGSTIAEQGYSASDLKLLVDEASKLAMKANHDISSDYLTAAAVEKVPPSISREQEETYLAFREQRKVGA